MRCPTAVALVGALTLACLAAPAAAAPLRIAYAAESAPGNLDIFTVTPSGDGAQRITSGPADDSFPAFSPARDEIVFQRVKPSGARKLFLVTPSGKGVHPIPHTLHAGAPSWSPDATRIAFASSTGGIVTVGPGGGSPKQLTEAHGDATPAWSPDSAHIVFARRGQLWLMRGDGSHLRKLTAHGTEPAWSPNGEHIAFVRETADGNRDLFSMNPDGTHVERLATNARRPAWEPNSRHIAFATGTGPASKIKTLLFVSLKHRTTRVTAGVTPAW